jgi:hypothetical protein
MDLDHTIEIELVEHEQAMWALLQERDFGALENRLSEDFRYIHSSGILPRAELLRLLHDVTLLSYDLHGFHVMPLAAESVMLLYEVEQTLHMTGELEETHSKTFASTVWRRRDDGWVWVFHMETPRP